MSIDNCPHCGDLLPPVKDAFCPFCHERLEAPPAAIGIMDPSSMHQPHASRPRASQPKGKVTVEVSAVLPSLCVLCGEESLRLVSVRFHRQYSVFKLLFDLIIGGGLLGPLILDEMLDERPIDLSLPVCSMHDNDARINSIKGTPRTTRRITLSGVHPRFVNAVIQLSRKRWDDLARMMSDAQPQNSNETENAAE